MGTDVRDDSGNSLGMRRMRVGRGRWTLMVSDLPCLWGLHPTVAYPHLRHSLCGSPVGLKCNGIRRYEDSIYNLRQLSEIDGFGTKELRQVIVNSVKTPSPGELTA